MPTTSNCYGGRFLTSDPTRTEKEEKYFPRPRIEDSKASTKKRPTRCSWAQHRFEKKLSVFRVAEEKGHQARVLNAKFQIREAENRGSQLDVTVWSRFGPIDGGARWY